MKTIKNVDLTLQITFALVLLLMIIPTGEYSDGFSYAMIGYAVFGAYQLLNALVTRLSKGFIQASRARKIYEITILAFLGLFFLFGAIHLTKLMSMLGYLLLGSSPMLAILYMVACYLEIKEIGNNSPVV
jgi:amino acid permease